MVTRQLAVCGALVMLAGCAAAPPGGKPPMTAPVATVKSTGPVIPAPTHPGLTLAAVGDLMLGTDYPENTLPDDDGLSFFDAVAPILQAPDVTFGNMEGVLQDG